VRRFNTTVAFQQQQMKVQQQQAARNMLTRIITPPNIPAGGQHKTDTTATAKTSKDANADGTAGTSLIAAAGSNGVDCRVDRRNTAGGRVGTISRPRRHFKSATPAVNRLAWHPRRPGLLPSASQDGTVILWERQRMPERQINDDKPSNRTSKGFLLRNQGVAVQSETIVFVAVSSDV
jgi:hypothetical protein